MFFCFLPMTFLFCFLPCSSSPSSCHCSHCPVAVTAFISFLLHLASPASFPCSCHHLVARRRWGQARELFQGERVLQKKSIAKEETTEALNKAERIIWTWCILLTAIFIFGWPLLALPAGVFPKVGVLPLFFTFATPMSVPHPSPPTALPAPSTSSPPWPLSGCSPSSLLHLSANPAGCPSLIRHLVARNVSCSTK